MELKINPHELIMIGENSFVRLTTDNGLSAATRCSHWRVLWSPAGAGHALFVDTSLVGGVQRSRRALLPRFLAEGVPRDTLWRSTIRAASVGAVLILVIQSLGNGRGPSANH